MGKNILLDINGIPKHVNRLNYNDLIILYRFDKFINTGEEKKYA